MQNDILRICNRSKVSGRISLIDLHAKCKLISLEQRMRKQLLWLMYLLSRYVSHHRISNRITRSMDKVVFKVPAKMIPTYEHSPYYIGTKLLNALSIDTQKAQERYAFKKETGRLYKKYEELELEDNASIH